MEDDFFAGIEQIDITMGEAKGKLPLFYRKARAFSAVFPAPKSERE
jgi:hypothetical protein